MELFSAKGGFIAKQWGYLAGTPANMGGVGGRYLLIVYIEGINLWLCLQCKILLVVLRCK